VSLRFIGTVVMAYHWLSHDYEDIVYNTLLEHCVNELGSVRELLGLDTGEGAKATAVIEFSVRLLKLWACSA